MQAQATTAPAHATTRSFNKALGVECTHCYVPDRWPESTKPQFTTARNMMRMVEAVNARLGDLGPMGHHLTALSLNLEAAIHLGAGA